ncbi:hypothetical protein EYF80_036290 [Liparis tanakae]|uniref:Uncharacterized protein n=1 Tax=Liparis tanakae TaxID=230148 RepID=A0A4Z2GJ47_9TELE|nr:hypothetical protein EYF80_036290 [Liparis tanakae]
MWASVTPVRSHSSARRAWRGGVHQAMWKIAATGVLIGLLVVLVVVMATHTITTTTTLQRRLNTPFIAQAPGSGRESAEGVMGQRTHTVLAIVVRSTREGGSMEVYGALQVHSNLYVRL